MNKDLERNRGNSVRPDQPNTWAPAPSRLRTPPTENQELTLPVSTRPQVLPFDALTWENFERFCLRFLELEAKAVCVCATDRTGEESSPVFNLFGQSGQAQDGIDIYARDQLLLGQKPPQRRYISLQSRRIKKVTPTELKYSVTEFVKGQWAQVSRKYIYATSTSVRDRNLTVEIERLRDQLTAQSIEFVVWDLEELSKSLKDQPKLVDDFFGRKWVEAFCGIEAAKLLGQRLDASEVARLRNELSRIYTVSFGIADSGTVGFQFGGTRPIPLRDRFVTPDLLSTALQNIVLTQPEGTLRESHLEYQGQTVALEEVVAWKVLTPEAGTWFQRGPEQKQGREVQNWPVLERRSVEQWIGTKRMQVIIGEPGTGKSTLLRYLVLDLLSDKPNWQTLAEKWGSRLPVWLPFHFLTQRVDGHTGEDASVGNALKAWLEQHTAGEIWPLVEKAINDRRLILIVDGLDEWVRDEAGQYAIRALEVFANSHDVSMVASTRPYGLDRLAQGAGWDHEWIAPLTTEQQIKLVLPYFQVIADTEVRHSSPGVLEQMIGDFLTNVHDVPDLQVMSGTPLFLVLLVGLHLSNSAVLPADRFGVYDQAIKMLIDVHPARRRTAAAVTFRRQPLSSPFLRKLLSRVAFMSVARGDVTTVQEAVLHKDFLWALRDPNYLSMNAKEAEETTVQLLQVTEGELGLLVRRGPAELSFLHRILQEQLAAEYVSDQMEPCKQKEFFARHVRNPRWREVLLATMWKITQPSQLSDLVRVIRERIDESPAGLRVREMLAEVSFGPYELPAEEILQSTREVIEVIETHSYGRHRSRLVDHVLAGFQGTVTKDVVRKCLDRWALLAQEPAKELIFAIAQIPSSITLSETICHLLLQALRSPESGIAYGGSIAIAARCSVVAPESVGERDLMRKGLLRILSDPPSGFSQAAALIALALEWRDDLLVADVLEEARSHTEESVRIVALSDAIGVLRPTFITGSPVEPADIQKLSDHEQEWVIEHLQYGGPSSIHFGLLVAAVSELVRGQEPILDNMLEMLELVVPSDENFGLIWSVLLNVFANDERVVDFVCSQLRSDNSSLSLWLMMGNEQGLAQVYPPESPHNSSVAAALEDRLGKIGKEFFPERLFGFAAVDRGPVMRETLLNNLTEDSWPYWSAEALVQYFGDRDDVRTALRLELMGDSCRAARIANTAPCVLAPREVIPHLLTVLRNLSNTQDSEVEHYSNVVAALIRACQEEGTGSSREFEEIATEVLSLVPSHPKTHFSNVRFRLAEFSYPSLASKKLLEELAQEKDRPLALYLRTLRDEPEQIEPLLEEATRILCSLPAYIRGQVTDSLAHRSTVPDEVVLRMTDRWADEVSSLNKSIASLAYHRALVRGREKGHIDEEQWIQAMANIGEQISYIGPDHEARKRSAVVGICVCKQWSMLTERVSLEDVVYGPDRVLLHQIATNWEELRSEFGDSLLARLSGTRAGQTPERAWDLLALVAAQAPALKRDLEHALVENPELLQLKGVLLWSVTRGSTNNDTVTEALISYLGNSSAHDDSLFSFLVAEPERYGLQPRELRGSLQKALPEFSVTSGNPILEALAMLCPNHPAVHQAWSEVSTAIESNQIHERLSLHPSTYFALAYAVTESSRILDQIKHNLDRLNRTSNVYIGYVFMRHVTHRLRCDSEAADVVREAILSPNTPDWLAAFLVSLFAAAVGLDDSLLSEIERRITVQDNVRLAPVLKDHANSASLPARTVLSRVADMAVSQVLE